MKLVMFFVFFLFGGFSDWIVWLLGNKLQDKFGGSFVVDNCGGVGGIIGIVMVKCVVLDGYIFFVILFGFFVIGFYLLKSIGYDLIKDFDYVSVVVQVFNVFVVLVVLL